MFNNRQGGRKRSLAVLLIAYICPCKSFCPLSLSRRFCSRHTARYTSCKRPYCAPNDDIEGGKESFGIGDGASVMLPTALREKWKALTEQQQSVLVNDMLDDNENEVMSCRFADYDSKQLASWLEEAPSAELTPRSVVLNCLCALRTKDIPTRNRGAALTIKFCSPFNMARTMSKDHFAAYLEEPWYKIIGEWAEIAMYSEEIDKSGNNAVLVVLLKREGDREWTSMSWDLGRYDNFWLVDRIWVDDV